MKGRVKWFNDAKGFGMIEDPSGSDVFVHYSAIRAVGCDDGHKTLTQGQEVEFDLYENPKGPHAQNVVIV